jgi:hypothetical protein
MKFENENFSILSDLKCYKSTFSRSTSHLWTTKPKEQAKRAVKKICFFKISKHGFFVSF